MKANSPSVLNKHRANEILAEAFGKLVECPDLRLGQAIISCMRPEEYTAPWPELFNDELPLKSMRLFYSIVEDGGKRDLTGSLDCGWFNSPLSRP